MRARGAVLLTALLLASGCGTRSTPSPAMTVAPIAVQPSGATEVTIAPAADSSDCDVEASLRPGPLPAPGTMPSGSTMARIADHGRLVVGVDQNTYLFGSRDPSSGLIEGFDIDLAREIARAIFGDPDRIDLRVVDANQREAVLRSGLVDLVARTYSVTCDRKKTVDFSTVYFYANQKVLAEKRSGIESAAQLGGKRVCAASGTTSLSRLLALQPEPRLITVPTWTDCLVMIQQGQADAVSTDDVVLQGLARQDPNVEVVGPSMGTEPYGIGIDSNNTDLVRFVNGVLERMRVDGTWERLYQNRLQSLGPSPGPPAPRYRDPP